MKASELRSGNLVQHQLTNEIITVIGEHIKQIEEGMDADILQAIRLTEEWLLKMGWIKHEKGWFWKDWGRNGTEIIQMLSAYNKFGYQLGKHRHKVLDYVHQTQNVFHALTGEELTIKE